MDYETTIALRYLRSKRKDKFISFTTWIAIAGIAIGVMAIILVIAVMTGFQDEIRERLLGIRPHIVLIPDWGVKEPKQVVERLKHIDGVVSASPFIEFQAMAQGPARVAGVIVRGLQPEDAAFLGRLMKMGSVDALKTSLKIKGKPTLVYAEKPFSFSKWVFGALSRELINELFSSPFKFVAAP